MTYSIISLVSIMSFDNNNNEDSIS